MHGQARGMESVTGRAPWWTDQAGGLTGGQRVAFWGCLLGQEGELLQALSSCKRPSTPRFRTTKWSVTTQAGFK